MNALKSALRGDVLRHVHPALVQQNLLLVIRMLGEYMDNARLFDIFLTLISGFFWHQWQGHISLLHAHHSSHVHRPC